MKAGDLVLFRGTWTPVAGGKQGPKTGVVMQIWTSRSQHTRRADIFWDNGEIRQVGTHLLGVICESR